MAETDGGFPRRTVLTLAAGVGAAGLLAACGGDDTNESSGSGSGSGSEASESGSPDAGGGGAGGALVATAEVPVGAGVILEDRKIVVTQPTEGTFKAFTAVCTHQACTVASVKDGTISCPCHGSAFSAADGSVKNGPASRPLKEIPVAVEGDQVVEA